MMNRAERIRRYWPTEREQAETTAALLEECPGLAELELRAVFKIRCRQWAEDAAAADLAEQHREEDEQLDGELEAWRWA